MSFQPPPGNTPPPPPPPGYGGAAGPGGFNAKSVSPLDWAIMGIGLLVFIFSFIDFYSSATVSYMGRSVSGDLDDTSAWHAIVGGGFFGWFAMLFGIVAAAAVAASIFRPQMRQKAPAYVTAVVLFLAAVVFEIIAIFVTPGIDGVPDSADVDINHGFGFWASLVLLVVGAVVSVMRAQQTNTALPGPLNNMPKIGR